MDMKLKSAKEVDGVVTVKAELDGSCGRIFT
jgi:hypothetical protein